MNKASHCFVMKDGSKKARNPEEPLSVFKSEVIFNFDKILNLIEQEKQSQIKSEKEIEVALENSLEEFRRR